MKKLLFLLLAFSTSIPSLELYKQPEIQKSIAIYSSLFCALTASRYAATLFCTEESLNCPFLKKYSFATPKNDLNQLINRLDRFPFFKTCKNNLESLISQDYIYPLKWAAQAMPLILSSGQNICCATLVPLLIAPDLNPVQLTKLNIALNSIAPPLVHCFMQDFTKIPIQNGTAFFLAGIPYQSLVTNEILPFFKTNFSFMPIIPSMLFESCYSKYALGFLLAYKCGFRSSFFDATVLRDGRIGRLANLVIYSAVGITLDQINNIIFEKIQATKKDEQSWCKQFLINNQKEIFDTLFGFSLFIVVSLIGRYMTKHQGSFAFGS